MQVENLNLHFFTGECANYQPAIDQSDWPIQTVIALIAFSRKVKVIGNHDLQPSSPTQGQIQGARESNPRADPGG